jgi:hypothetical protein
MTITRAVSRTPVFLILIATTVRVTGLITASTGGRTRGVLRAVKERVIAQFRSAGLSQAERDDIATAGLGPLADAEVVELTQLHGCHVTA